MSPSPRSRAVHGFRVEEHDVVTSTQELLRVRLAAGHAVANLVVRAKQQSAGRGRRGTPWSSSLGGSYQSLALALDGLPAVQVGTASGVDGRLTLALGLGIAETLAKAGAPLMVKWPNDLMLRDKKLGGIIVEVVAGNALAGIGLNVDNEHPAGTTALRGWDVSAVGDLVLEGVKCGVAALAQSPEEFASRYRIRDWLRGRAVSIATRTSAERSQSNRSRDQETTLEGLAAGINLDGSLRLERGDGSFERVVSSHVTTC